MFVTDDNVVFPVKRMKVDLSDLSSGPTHVSAPHRGSFQFRE